MNNSADADAHATISMNINKVKSGTYMMIEGRLCKARSSRIRDMEEVANQSFLLTASMCSPEESCVQ